MKIKSLKGRERHFKGSKGYSSKIKAFKGFKGSLRGLQLSSRAVAFLGYSYTLYAQNNFCTAIVKVCVKQISIAKKLNLRGRIAYLYQLGCFIDIYRHQKPLQLTRNAYSRLSIYKV